MSNFLIIITCALIGAFATSLLTDNRSPILGDRIIVASLGAASGATFALVIVAVRLIL